MPDNTSIAQFNGMGASDQTAGQDHLQGGPAASRQMAATDFGRVRPLVPRFESAGARVDLPPALLAAIASRETRCGNVLDAAGWGDQGNAFGIMQVDKRFHEIAGEPDPKSQAHIDQASGILQAYFAVMRERFPDVPVARQLQAAIAAYNCGPDSVASPDTADLHTTGRDYSNDTWVRAAYYVSRWPATGA